MKNPLQVARTHFSTVIHEMGHVHYFLAYMDQDYLFREGANPAFHEAVADSFMLAGKVERMQDSLS